MALVRWFRVEVCETWSTGWSSRMGVRRMAIYFYETDTGLYGLQYGLAKDTTCEKSSLQDAMSDLRVRLQAEHTLDGVKVSLGIPLEVTWDEVKQKADMWYYRLSSKEFDRVSLEKLKQLFESGELTDSYEVRRDGSPFWSYVKSVPELQPKSRWKWLACLRLWWQRVNRDAKMRQQQKAETKTLHQNAQKSKAEEQRKRNVMSSCIHDWRYHSDEDRGIWFICNKCGMLCVEGEPKPDKGFDAC